jgi:uncharacterized protein YerC
MKRRTSDLTKEETIVTLDTLYTAASTLKGRDAVKLFLRDLLTPSERIMLGRRIIIARLLIAGESYDKIRERMGVGRNTIGRVQRWLEDQFPGFEHAVAEIEKEFKRRERKRLYATSSLYQMKKKYPLYYFLLPTPEIKSKPIYPSKKRPPGAKA